LAGNFGNTQEEGEGHKRGENETSEREMMDGIWRGRID
jgi:hypothetical protein